MVSTSASTAASPHSTRCSPQIHRSPGRETGSARGLGRFVDIAGVIARASQQPVDFRLVEAQQSEVYVLLPERNEFGRQQLLVPARIEGNLIVSDDVGPPLSGRQVIKDDHRDSIEAKLTRGQQPAMAGNDAALPIDQDRIGPAELDNRGRDLRNLVVVVCTGVARIGDQPVEGPVHDRVGQSQHHVVSCGWDTARGGN
jgi:hypothetical protein